MKSVLVVGGGIAGCMAAIAARRRGADVTLVYRAPGATALASGAFEVGVEADAKPADALHPLERLDVSPSELRSELNACIDALVTATGFVRTHSVGTYLDCFGRPRRADFIPQQAAAGEVSGLENKIVGVVEVEGVGDYDAETVALSFCEEGVDARSVHLSVQSLPSAADLADIADTAAPQLPSGGFDAFALPPGFAEIPPNAFELVASTVSPRGWQLQRALWSAVEAAGVAVKHARVDCIRVDDTRVATASFGGMTHAADAFVLATGRFIGGGLDHANGSERLLELPMFYSGQPASLSRLRLQHLLYLDSEPAFAAGLLTDTTLRPLDTSGNTAFDNVRVAGSLLAGADDARFGFVAAMLTGWLAGAWSTQ